MDFLVILSWQSGLLISDVRVAMIGIMHIEIMSTLLFNNT